MLIGLSMLLENSGQIPKPSSSLRVTIRKMLFLDGTEAQSRGLRIVSVKADSAGSKSHEKRLVIPQNCYRLTNKQKEKT